MLRHQHAFLLSDPSVINTLLYSSLSRAAKKRPHTLFRHGHQRYVRFIRYSKRRERRNMAFVCRLTKTHARFTASLSNFLNHLRAEQALENADYYGVEKSKELHVMFPLQRHFKSLFSGSAELFWLYGAATLVFKSKQRKNNWV